MSTLLALFETSGIIDTITSVIGTLLYPLFSIIFVLISAIQDVFYAFAGIGTSSFGGTPIYSGDTGAENDQGILYYLLNEPFVKNMLISIALLALFLIVIFHFKSIPQISFGNKNTHSIYEWGERYILFTSGLYRRLRNFTSSGAKKRS